MSGDVKTRVIIDADAGNAIKEINTLDAAAADADTALKALDDTKIVIDVDADKLDQVKHKADDATGSSRAASTAIGGIGNSVSELPGVGALGPLAESFGQLTENALEGEASIGDMGKAIGVLGGTAVVMFGIQKAMKSIAETDAFNEEQAEDYADAIKEVGEGAKAVLETLKKTGEVTGRAGGLFGTGVFEGTKNITKLLLDAGVTADEFADAVSKGGPALDIVTGKLRVMRNAAAAVDNKDVFDDARVKQYDEAIEIVTESHGNYADAVATTTTNQEFANTSTRGAVEGLEVLGPTLDEVAEAQERAGEASVKMAERVEEGMGRAGDAADRLLGKLDLERAVINWNSSVKEMADKFAYGIASSTAEVNSFETETIQTLKDLGADPATLIKVTALFDDGFAEEDLATLQQILAGQAMRNPVLVPLRFVPDPNQPRIRNPVTGGSTPTPMMAPTNNITVNLPRAAGARDVTAALTRWARVNG